MTPDEDLSKPWKKKQSLIRRKNAEAIQHLEQEELRDNQNKILHPEAPVSQYVYYTFAFSDIQQAVAFSKTVSFPVDASELYKMGSVLF